MRNLNQLGIGMLICVSTFLSHGCSKNNTGSPSGGGGVFSTPACQTNNTGTFYFENPFDSAYDLYINGSKVGNVSAGSSSSHVISAPFTTSAGNVSAKAVPSKWWYSTKTATVPLAQCGTSTFTWQ